MVDHPAARVLTGYLLVRGGVDQVAYAGALENLTGAKMEEIFLDYADPHRNTPSAAAHHTRRTPRALSLVADDSSELGAVFNGPAPGNMRGLE